jgi:hypothetical protein
MGVGHLAQVGSMWAAQAHEPTNRPSKSRIYCKCHLMGVGHQAQVGSMWAAQAHQPTYRPSKSWMSQMSVNGLLTSSPCGFDVGSPSPRAHLTLIQKSDIANVILWASDIKPKWARYGQPKPTSPLIAHTEVGYCICHFMGVGYQTQVGSMWAAQAHQPT